MTNYDQFLKQSLNKYKNPDIAKRDVLTVFTAFSDLRPKLEDFVFNDGTRKSLLQLDGTIPVNYKGAVYNIPICIWLLDTHPYNPPMVYVKPTSTMQIKSGRNVDMNGKVDLPYLREWKYPNSELVGMIQILAIVFGDEPPVYSRQHPPAQQPIRYPNQTPYPPSGTSSFPMPMPGQTGSQQAPYPQNTAYPSGGYPQQGASYPGQYTGYPSQQTSYQGYPQQSYPTSTSSPAYPGSYPPPYSQSQASNFQSTSSTASNVSGTVSGTSTVTEEHLKASLLSAVEDKIKWRLKETFAQAQAEMDVLYKTQADLLKGKDKLETMIKDLEKEKSDISANIQLLKQKDGEVKEALSRLENQEQITIDDAVVTTAPLYRQLLKSFAEEQAIEDAIYYLGEALRKDVIELEVFLKRVRELSRQQFKLRALIQKCREKAGLPPLA